MRTLASVLLAFSVAASVAAQSASGNDAVAARLMQMERDWCRALTTKDPAILAPILADDYTSVNSRGVMATKASELADTKAGASGFATCVNDRMNVRVFGDAAVITGHNTASGTFKGAAFKDRESYWTDTYVRRNGRWQCVASHGSPAALPEKLP
jgi:ketosteroid isomerase-like protein